MLDNGYITIGSLSVRKNFSGKSESCIMVSQLYNLHEKPEAPFLSSEMALLDSHIAIKSHAEACWPLVLHPQNTTSLTHKVIWTVNSAHCVEPIDIAPN